MMKDAVYLTHTIIPITYYKTKFTSALVTSPSVFAFTVDLVTQVDGFCAFIYICQIKSKSKTKQNKTKISSFANRNSSVIVYLDMLLEILSKVNLALKIYLFEGPQLILATQTVIGIFGLYLPSLLHSGMAYNF